jgi:hypothetical protein
LHQSTFISRRQNVSPSWAVWRLCGPMVFILAYYCLYRWMWYLQVFGNCSHRWTRLVGVYIFFLRSSFTFTFKSFSRRSYPERLTNWCIHLMTSSGTATLQ